MENTQTTSFKIAALKQNGTLFNVKGQSSRAKNEKGIYVDVPEDFKATRYTSDHNGKVSHSFGTNHLFGSSMNVSRFGRTKVSLYTFTPFGKQVKQTIPYSHITIVSVKELTA